MEQEAQGTTDPPPRTPAGRTIAVGDLVYVFQGTAAYVRGRNSVAYIGRIAGYNDAAGKWEVRDVTMSKRGQANKVDEKWMSPCNQEGLSPFQNSARLNLKTISVRQRERLEKKADESHGWELAGKHKEVKRLRDDSGKELYGAEEWKEMEEQNVIGWADFPCANHARNLHFDAFNRGFTAWVKETLGPALEGAKARGGGKVRVEPQGENLIRSICKLVHIGPKQYTKGDGIAFADFLKDKFPELTNSTISRGELGSRQDWTAETSYQIYPMYDAILQYTVETLLLDANILRDSVLVRMELIHFECYLHVNASMWRLVYRELRALTNDSTLNLNPLEINDLYDYLWDVGSLLECEESLTIYEDGWRPWARVKGGTEASMKFYAVHDRHKQRDMDILRKYKRRTDIAEYKIILQKVLSLFGAGIKESLTRSMGEYLEATGGRLRNSAMTMFEKDIASRIICTNNPAEGPFATARAFLHLYPTLKLRTLATLCAAIVNGTFRPPQKRRGETIAAGFGLRAPPELLDVIGELCSVRRRNPGKITTYMREQVAVDEVEGKLIRTQRKAAKLEAKKRAQATRMAHYDLALETTFANTQAELEDEITSYGSGTGNLLIYLREQFKGRNLLRKGNYKTIPTVSKFRSVTKPYKLRLNLPAQPGLRITTNEQIEYLTQLLNIMIAEDSTRQLEPTLRPDETKLVRCLPVISERFLNPLALRLKTVQEAQVRAMATPKDNPWLSKLQDEYLGKILYDGGYFRVFAIQFVPNKNTNRFPCWEATTEPVFEDENGKFVVHDRHVSIGKDCTRTLLKSSMVGFALAEYCNGDEADPVHLTFADACIAKFLTRQARASATPSPSARKRPAQNRAPTARSSQRKKKKS